MRRPDALYKEFRASLQGEARGTRRRLLSLRAGTQARATPLRVESPRNEPAMCPEVNRQLPHLSYQGFRAGDKKKVERSTAGRETQDSSLSK